MASDSVHEVVRELTAAGLVTPETLQGCSEQEIAALERDLGVQLPAIYREFLAVMGRRAGTFFEGTDFLYRDLPTLREQAEHLLRRCNAGLALDHSDFVFAVHQGYTFLFFRCGGSDDPPVRLYEEDETSFREVAKSFSSWLVGAARDEIDADADLET